MPFYEYQCENCSEIFEVFVRNGEQKPDRCEVCGGKLHKIISVSSFHLKGSGWYITDYSRKNSASDSISNNSSKKENDEKVGSSKETFQPKKEIDKGKSSVTEKA